MGAPLEGDIHAEGVQPLEWIIEAKRGRFRIPAALHVVLFPEVEPAKIDSRSRHSCPRDQTLGEGKPRSEERRVGKECRSRWSREHREKRDGRASTVTTGSGS